MAMVTDNEYWASLDPRLQKLRYMPGVFTRYEYATQLAIQGLLVDFVIQIWQYFGGPAQCMALRKSLGYTWIPALGYPSVEAAPGITPPPGSGLKPYDPNPPFPVGSIKVSDDAADYPAWEATH